MIFNYIVCRLSTKFRLTINVLNEEFLFNFYLIYYELELYSILFIEIFIEIFNFNFIYCELELYNIFSESRQEWVWI